MILKIRMTAKSFVASSSIFAEYDAVDQDDCDEFCVQRFYPCFQEYDGDAFKFITDQSLRWGMYI
jgi:hypothetical protein